MKMNKRQPSPCLRCLRVEDPRKCENKNCQLWQRWFIDQWNMLRADPRQAMEQVELKPVGVAIGGRRYAAPHQTRSYLRKDPCDACRCPKEFCTSPCPTRRAWEEARKDVLI